MRNNRAVILEQSQRGSIYECDEDGAFADGGGRGWGPTDPENALLSDAVLEISIKGLGFTAIVNNQSEPIGMFTDGDLRRQLSKKMDYEKQPIKDIMNKTPKTIFDDQIIIDAINLMELNKINGILVVNRENKLIGAFNMHDLFKAKVI